MFRVIIAGSRNFNGYPLLRAKMDYYLMNIDEEIEIVSGGASGADSLGEKYAKERGYKLTIMNANWDLFGRSAGYIRNEEMAKYADACVVFWDGKSRGTKHMIDLANKEGIVLKVVTYEEAV